MILCISCVSSCLVLRFGSLWQSWIVWPSYLQHMHFWFFVWVSSLSLLSSSSSSSSSLLWCELDLHPLAFLSVFPQHHQYSSLKSKEWVLQLHLKFSFSVYSIPQFLHYFRSTFILPFLYLILIIRCFYLSISTFMVLMFLWKTVFSAWHWSNSWVSLVISCFNCDMVSLLH